MTTSLRYPKGYQFFDGNGHPLAIASLSYFQAGATARQDTYLNATGTTPNANPIVLDGSGRLPVDVYLGSSTDYKEVLTTFDGATVSPWPADNIPRAGASSSGGSNTDLSATRAATTLTVQSSTGTATTLASADSTYAGVLTSADKQKLDGIAAGAQTQPTSAQIVTAIDTQLGSQTWRAGDMGGATSSVAGSHGLAPQPNAGDQGKFLRGDATWQTLGTAAAKDVPASGNASTAQVVYGTDTRLSDARTPSSHAASHAAAGSDPLSLAASQISGIPASLASQNLDNVARLGIGTTDSGNKLSVSAPSVLFSNSGDMRATISKGAASNSAAFNFQDNFSTRVQFGLLGNDDFTVSTSPDGSTFKTGLVVNKSTGAVAFPNSSGFTGDSGSGGAVGLVPAPVSGDAAAGKFLKADGTWTVAGGSSSDMTGATSGANGAHGLVPQPNAGDQGKFLKGDGTWGAGSALAAALSGTPLQSFSFRDPAISGFTGAGYETYEDAVAATAAYGSGNVRVINVANGESLLIRSYFHGFATDYSKAIFNEITMLVRRPSSGNVVRSGNLYSSAVSISETGANHSSTWSVNATNVTIGWTNSDGLSYNNFMVTVIHRLKSNS